MAAPTWAARPRAWLSNVPPIASAVLLALTLRAFVFEAYKIPSGSMIPTLAIGDQIWVNKFIYGLRVPFTTTRVVSFAQPKRGEVVVFVCPKHPHEDYIKRVVGLPGDEVAVRDGVLFINGRAVEQDDPHPLRYTDRDEEGWQELEAHAHSETLGSHHFMVLHEADAQARRYHDAPPRVVPQGHVFMMGDNRDHSSDSREWGPVPFGNLIGRSTFIWWSWGKGGLNPARLGTWVP